MRDRFCVQPCVTQPSSEGAGGMCDVNINFGARLLGAAMTMAA